MRLIPGGYFRQTNALSTSQLSEIASALMCGIIVHRLLKEPHKLEEARQLYIEVSSPTVSTPLIEDFSTDSHQGGTVR